MKEIGGRFPKFWEDFYEYMKTEHGYAHFHNFTFLECFGYLVLEYFPKHGIKIGCYTDGSFAVKDGNDWVHDEDGHVIGFQSPQQAITKAAEIRERQLEEK